MIVINVHIRGKEMNENHIVRKGFVVFIVVFIVAISISQRGSGLSREKDEWTNTKISENSLRDDNDTTPPVTTISYDPLVPNGLSGWYVTNVTVILNASDNGSGVLRTYCSLLPPGETYTEPILISEDGEYFIYFYSIDYAGNVEFPKSVVLKIDKTPPVVMTTVERIGLRKWLITVEASDALSGINKVEFYLNDILQDTLSGAGPFLWSFIFVWRQTHCKLKIIGHDIAGNNVSDSPMNLSTLTWSWAIGEQSIQQMTHFFYFLNGICITHLEKWFNHCEFKRGMSQ